jgi:hypothetical protein
MDTLTKTITLNVPKEVIYEVIKFTNISDDWNQKYFKNFFDFPIKNDSTIVRDIKNKKFVLRVDLEEHFGETHFLINEVGKDKIELTITHKYDYDTDTLDKLTLWSDVISYLMFDLGYQKGRERGLLENIFI